MSEVRFWAANVTKRVNEPAEVSLCSFSDLKYDESYKFCDTNWGISMCIFRDWRILGFYSNIYSYSDLFILGAFTVLRKCILL